MLKKLFLIILIITSCLIVSKKILFAWDASDTPVSYSLFASTNTYPYQIVLDGGGNLYVTITGNSSLSKYDSSGNLLSSFGSAFSGPTGVSVASNGNIYIANTQQDKIEIYTSSGSLVSTFGSTGSGNNQFSAPYSISFDSSGNIYVADAGNNRVQKFDSNFNYLSTITGNGSAFNYPQVVDVDSQNNIYVLDSGNNRVQVFDSTLSFVRNITGSGGAWNYPEAMTVDGSDNLYVGDSGNDRIQVFDTSGNFKQSFGTSGTSIGQFQYITGLYMSDTGILYVGDQNRIQKVTFDRQNASISINGEQDGFLIGSVTDQLTSITSVSFSIDGGSYQNCISSDGTFDEASENFKCNISQITSIGSHTIVVRATDSKSNTNSGSDLGNFTYTIKPNDANPPVINCTDKKPKIPEILRIDKNEDKATIFIKKDFENNKYLIEYGISKNPQYANEFWVNHVSTLEAIDINFLDRNKNYYFRVKSQKGCNFSDWTSWILSQTSSVIQNPVSTPASTPAPTIVPKPSIVPEVISNLTPYPTANSSPTSVKIEENDQNFNNQVLVAGTTGFISVNLLFFISSISSSLFYIYSNSKRSILNFPKDVVLTLFSYPAIFARRKTSGVVFDTSNNKPLGNALLYFFSDSGNLKTTYSNMDGKYEINLTADEYKIRVDKSNYTYPSNIVKIKSNGIYTNIYIHPEKIPIDQNQQTINHLSFALDPSFSFVKLIANNLLKFLGYAGITYFVLVLFNAYI